MTPSMTWSGQPGLEATGWGQEFWANSSAAKGERRPGGATGELEKDFL